MQLFNWKKIPKIVLAFCLVLLIFSLTNCESRSNPVMEDTVSVKHFYADELIAELGSHDANLKESVVTVEGFILDINNLNNRNTILLKGEGSSNTSVICDMQLNQIESIEKLKLGQPIKIKGILKGSLKDVILLNCIISN